MRSALYIPQGTWHGVEAQSAELEIFWVVSPPHFAETLRESAKASDAGKVPADLDEVGRKHGYRDSRHYALGAALATIVTLLALAMGSLSSIVIALSALLIAVAIFIATLGGIGVRALASRLASRSS